MVKESSCAISCTGDSCFLTITNARGWNIRKHSITPREDEIILAPGTLCKIISVSKVSDARCPSDHALEKKVADWTTGRHSCDMCGPERDIHAQKYDRPTVWIPKGATMYGCSICNWDACNKCFANPTTRTDVTLEVVQEGIEVPK